MREYRIDLPRALEAGISWRRLQVLIGGLSAASVYRLLTRRAGSTYTAANAGDYFAQFPKAGE